MGTYGSETARRACQRRRVLPSPSPSSSTPIEGVLLPHAAQAQSAGLKKGCGRAQSRATLQQVKGFGYAWYRRERWFDGSLLRDECSPRRWDAICKLFFFRCGLDTRRSDREIGKSGFKGQALDDLLGRRRGVMATGRVDLVATATSIPMKGPYKDPRIAPPRHQGRLTRQILRHDRKASCSRLFSLRSMFPLISRLRRRLASSGPVPLTSSLALCGPCTQ